MTLQRDSLAGKRASYQGVSISAMRLHCSTGGAP
jgi:hypothetical protein